MGRLMPPSPARVRAARALGLRPRARLLVLAGLAVTCAAALELFPRAANWLSDHLDSVFLGAVSGPPKLAAWSAAGLLALVVGLGLAVVITAPRRRARASLGVSPGAEQIAPAIVLASIVAVALLVVLANLGAIAGAARSVDATTRSLTAAWLGWIRRGLFALAGAALGVGLIERWLSGNRLWRGLHQTPARARREARASGRR